MQGILNKPSRTTKLIIIASWKGTFINPDIQIPRLVLQYHCENIFFFNLLFYIFSFLKTYIFPNTLWKTCIEYGNIKTAYLMKLRRPVSPSHRWRSLYRAPSPRLRYQVFSGGVGIPVFCF